MLKYDKNFISKKLNDMSDSQRIAFAAACCERLLPNYVKFVEVENGGDYSFFRSMLNQIWNHAGGKHMTNESIKQLMKKCFEIVPDSDDFESIYTSYAIDTGAAFYNTLKYCLESDIKFLISVVDASINTVDLFVQEKHNMNPNDPDLEQKIMNDQVMQNEVKKQVEDLNLIRNQQTMNEQFLTSLRLSIEGNSNIEL